MRLMEIPGRIDLVPTETNGWLKTSILWSSVLKNDVVF